MTQAGPLRWRTGAGWLVLAGGGKWQNDETGEIDAAALGWANLDRPIAVLPTAGSTTAEGEALLEYYADLGGPSGYIVPIFGAADAQSAENCQLLAEAGLVYIADGPDVLSLVKALRESPALEALVYAFAGGAAILGMAAGATALGGWVAARQTQPGWGWLPDIVVEPHFVGTEASSRLQNLLNVHANCFGLGIPTGMALALGPDGQVVTVGDGQVTIVVGEVERESSGSTDQRIDG